MTVWKRTRSTQKVRRDWAGGKRAEGRHWRKHGRRVRRPDPRHVRIGDPDDSVTGYAGLATFGEFVRGLGVDRELRRFARLKSGPNIVYPMRGQLRLLMDTFAVGEHRPFALEALSADPLFVHLAGGMVPSLDTVYRDLARFDMPAVSALEGMVAAHGLELLKSYRRKRNAVIHLDVDTTVTPLFGEHEGALPGPNPRYRGRPSYHPMLARVAETDTIVGAQLRPGDRAFGIEDVPTIAAWVERTREAVGPRTRMYVRVDAAGDCTELLQAIHERGAHFLVKARITQDLAYMLWQTTRWWTIDRDADNKPRTQFAIIDFARHEWQRAGLRVRVIAIRSKERDTGKQLYLWEDEEYSVQAFLTNDFDSDPAELAYRYNGRAGIEPLIAELKGAYGIGKVPSDGFLANHAALLLKLLVHNLMRRFVATKFAHLPPLRSWRAPWLRRLLIRVPGRLVRHGRRRTLRIASGSLLHQLE